MTLSTRLVNRARGSQRELSSHRFGGRTHLVRPAAPAWVQRPRALSSVEACRIF